MSVGDLVIVKSNNGNDVGKIYCTGIYLGTQRTWKDWHIVRDFKGNTMHWDEPFWELEVINASR